MSIDTQIENEWTPVPTDTKPSARRATSIAEQIAQGWRALPEEERQRWKESTDAVTGESSRKPVHLHLKPRALPADRELFIEQLHTEPSHPADIVDNTAGFVDDRDLLATSLPVAGPTMLPPWRLPGAFSDGLENVPLRKPVPRDDDKEEARKFCMALESEKHFQAFEAFLLAHRKPEAEEAHDESERPAKVRRRRAVKKGEMQMTWFEFRMHRRMRTSTNIPTRLYSWWY